MKFFQDGDGRHLGFVRTVNSAVRSAVPKGGATVLKVGDNFASGASEKNFLTPPPYDYLGGTEINMVVLNLLIGMA